MSEGGCRRCYRRVSATPTPTVNIARRRGADGNHMVMDDDQALKMVLTDPRLSECYPMIQ